VIITCLFAGIQSAAFGDIFLIVPDEAFINHNSLAILTFSTIDLPLKKTNLPCFSQASTI